MKTGALILTLASLLLMGLIHNKLSTDRPVPEINSPEDYHADLSDWRTLRQLFKVWKKHNSKFYGYEAEEERRFVIWCDNLRTVKEHNALDLPFKLGMNKFADLTLEEFTQRTSCFNESHINPDDYDSSLFDEDIASENIELNQTSKDWRTLGAVTSIKDQGNCGCCWSFSGIAALETLQYRKLNRLVNLSEQQALDCTRSYSNFGCDGGDSVNVYKYVSDHGIRRRIDYPYTAVEGPVCKYNDSQKYFNNTSWKPVPSNDSVSMRTAVDLTVITAGVEANNKAFQLYSRGIITTNCTTILNHVITIVGYGTSTTGIPFWTVKNSWSTLWGEQGYFRISRGQQNTGMGVCGINKWPAYPT